MYQENCDPAEEDTLMTASDNQLKFPAPEGGGGLDFNHTAESLAHPHIRPHRNHADHYGTVSPPGRRG